MAYASSSYLAFVYLQLFNKNVLVSSIGRNSVSVELCRWYPLDRAAFFKVHRLELSLFISLLFVFFFNLSFLILLPVDGMFALSHACRTAHFTHYYYACIPLMVLLVSCVHCLRLFACLFGPRTFRQILNCSKEQYPQFLFYISLLFVLLFRVHVIRSLCVYPTVYQFFATSSPRKNLAENTGVLE